jgi:dUTP pyrophosphatase
MQLQVRLLSKTAKIPSRGSLEAAGLDLYADETVCIAPSERRKIRTGVALSIPPNHVGLIWPRSGLAFKQGIDTMAGVIDSDYRGEIEVVLLNTDKYKKVYIDAGTRIAQILIQPVAMFAPVDIDALDETERGANGFGSTGH